MKPWDIKVSRYPMQGMSLAVWEDELIIFLGTPTDDFPTHDKERDIVSYTIKGLSHEILHIVLEGFIGLAESYHFDNLYGHTTGGKRYLKHWDFPL